MQRDVTKFLLTLLTV